MGTIQLEVGGYDSPLSTARFRGEWLVDPADEIRSLEPGAALGAFYGVARTGRGSVAVYMAHVNDRFDASVRRYPSLIAALRDGLPNDIAFAALRAAKAQGEE